ncbi:putative filamentous growth regulator [Clavispora lusitaniae]|uniref:C2H2-type domain-containing protein n=2 Tax=Clavispora lusitaniae TaxID=36911 RepID=C4Y5J5_CLAL4|nr:uncharacterized protein CLUG_03429 [Clavispora lusitaniae ATCC 42720]QFZ28194.1 putative filamentous growth regulator [Clavispora lusitaniae]EEQ39301.1 hypothetical protein CLUG_03429 [Clavispora lusitaniae ATCC 42720]QFZ33857.1 putative filamentous growth regulator [Clavispora lusitaniae]QFZ39541.1 putative filamentous growth regulator [Clavispora lusitaniae]QFZ45223.1 putative filamentous growth regulator [Clavispora lusitaniae]
MSAAASDPEYDPIIEDLKKIVPSNAPSSLGFEADMEIPSIKDYSLRLASTLELLLEETSDDSRMQYEVEVKDMTVQVPVSSAEQSTRKYPDDYLSRILIDCYQPLMKLSTSYFNLAFSSHITKFLVNVVYSLECWEIYHLLQMIPSFSYFLKLVDIGVTETPLGNIVSPPQNLMRFNLRQGFQYPFPYPAYHFSYHTIDPHVSARKYARVQIKPYIDLRLKKTKPQVAKPLRKNPQPYRSSTDGDESSESRVTVSPVKQASHTSEADFARHHKVYIFMRSSPKQIEEESLNLGKDEEDDDEEYDSESALAQDKEDLEKMDPHTRAEGKYVFVPSSYEERLQNDQRTKARLATVHQCRLLDPGTNRPCLKIFYGRNELRRHKEFVHATNRKLYRCVFCEKEGNNDRFYPRHDSLARHIRRQHGITGRENKTAVSLAKQHAEIREKSPIQSVPPNAYFTLPSQGPVPVASSSYGNQTNTVGYKLPPLSDPKTVRSIPYQTIPPPLQFANLPPYLPPPSTLLQDEESTKSFGRGMPPGYQKFRFPNNYYPPANSQYGPVYGATNVFSNDSRNFPGSMPPRGPILPEGSSINRNSLSQGQIPPTNPSDERK